LSAVDYHNLMLGRLYEVSDERVKALGEIEREKLRVARAYNKRVKGKIISSQRPCLEDDFAYWVYQQQVREVVTKLGRTV
jgi:hypothetical protein